VEAVAGARVFAAEGEADGTGGHGKRVKAGLHRGNAGSKGGVWSNRVSYRSKTREWSTVGRG